MSIQANRETQLANAIHGWQALIKGTNTAVSGTPTINDLDPTVSASKLSGATLSAAGTYYYLIPCAGATQVDLTLRASALSGTITVTAYKTLVDGVTEKMDSAGASAAITITLAAATQKTGTVSLRGERCVVLKIVVAAASSVTFDQAEYSAL